MMKSKNPKIRKGDILINTLAGKVLNGNYYIVMVLDKMVGVRGISFGYSKGISAWRKYQDLNQNPGVWYEKPSNLLGNYYDIPSGMKKRVMKLIASPDLLSVEYAMGVLGGYKHKLNNKT